MKFDRIMLKLSGEALGGDDGTGIDPETLGCVVGEINSLVDAGIEVAVVIGAGNFFRGIKGAAKGMDRVTADQIGMVATVMNGMALADALSRSGVKAVVTSAFPTGSFTKTYSPALGRKMLSKGKVVICTGGTGNPFFTTDTAAVLRALELECGAMFKATKVDGVYDKDPEKFNDAVRFQSITFEEVLEKKLGVMDLTGVTLAESGNLPIVVFKLTEKGAALRLAGGDFSQGTLISVGKDV